MYNQDMICYCSDVTKEMIIEALQKGAETLDDIREMTGACTKARCRELSPRGTCCSPLIIQIIEEYNHV